MMAEPERVGVIIVHGIGEQRRFDHLDGQTRFLLNALQGLKESGDVESISVDIVPGDSAAFHAEQDSWNGGRTASVKVLVRRAAGLRDIEICVHEVWWADVNEPYSVIKQVRFWLWGLSVWSHPGKKAAHRPTSGQVAPLSVSVYESFCARVELYLVAVFFILFGLLGVATDILTRLFQLVTPKYMRLVTNYVSAVKLYNQRKRLGAGLLSPDDFLDTIGEPPRVSIRRRMIRALSDVVLEDYSRWYVLAHSQGAVVAYNGLMETGYAWPGYLDQERWKALEDARYVEPVQAGLAPDWNVGEATLPRRPAWVDEGAAVDRQKIFQNFRGLLTYGAPLAKFAYIWPALVPMSKVPAIPAEAEWVNLFDPLDPVSGRLERFATQANDLNAETKNKMCCPAPQTLGFNAGYVLLYTHLQYLTRRNLPSGDAATAAVRWLLSGSFARPKTDGFSFQAGRWFEPAGVIQAVRRAAAWLWWFVAAFALLALDQYALGHLVPRRYLAPVLDWLIGHGAPVAVVQYLVVLGVAFSIPLVVGTLAAIPWMLQLVSPSIRIPIGFLIDTDDARISRRTRKNGNPVDRT